MEPKIAILTYFNAYNYGGDLQCYALQRKLRNMGYDARVLNLARPVDSRYKKNEADTARFKKLYEYSAKSDKKSKLKNTVFRAISSIYSLFISSKIKKRNTSFKSFHKEHIKFSTKQFINFSELYEYADKLDYTHYIVGSDQVWNYTYPFSVEPYFLTFTDKAVKISYAASIGHSDLPEDIADIYKDWLQDFKAISLREQQGEELIKQITNRDDIQTVLDPTFLLSKEEWINGLSIDKPLVEGDYLLVYLLSRSDESLDIAKKIAKMHNYKVVGITSSFLRHKDVKGVDYFVGNSPKDFVNLFAYAKFAVTNSFHGTSFSINFNIPFISTTRRNKRVNSRFINILNKISLPNRLIYEGDNLDIENLPTIDFSVVNLALETERNKSLEFLNNALA